MTETDRNFNKVDSELRQLEEYIHSLELALASSKEQLKTEKRKHEDTANWALEQQNRADLSEKRETILQELFEATNPWVASFDPNPHRRCLYCKAEPRLTTIPQRTDFLSAHSNTCIFAKSVKEVVLKQPAEETHDV